MDTQDIAVVVKETKINHLNQVCVCDNNHTFLAMDALLVPFINHDKDIGKLTFADNDFVLKRGTNPEKIEEFGYLLACPICGVVHLSGFNPAPKENLIMQGKDNTQVERKLDPEL